MQSCDDSEVVFGIVQPQYGRVFMTSHNRKHNIDSPQHTRDSSRSRNSGFSGQFGAEKGQSRSIS